MSNILSQAKQVETQLVNQQERLSAKETQLHMQVQKLQDEVGFFFTLGMNGGNWESQAEKGFVLPLTLRP